MDRLWWVVSELSIPPGKAELNGALNPESILGFTNWIAWADSAQGSEQRVRATASAYGWIVIGIERVEAVTDENEFSESLRDIIHSADLDPKLCAHCEIHSYPLN